MEPNLISELKQAHKELVNKSQSPSFDFIANPDLKQILIQEYEALIYMEKLGKLLRIKTSEELHPYLKFQIVQYASIYEAIIDYLLLEEFANHELVKKLMIQEEVKQIPELQSIRLKFRQDDIYFCKKRHKEVKSNFIRVPFQQRVDVATKIGFLSHKHTRHIQDLYNIRNGIHIRSRANNKTKFELQDCEQARQTLPAIINDIFDFQEINTAYKYLYSGQPADMLNAIKTLQSISEESDEYLDTIMSTVAYFVRNELNQDSNNIAKHELLSKCLNLIDKALKKQDFRNKIIKIDLSNTYLEQTNLSGSNFAYATFRNSNLKKSDFSRSYLVRVDWRNSDLESVNFESSNLRGSDFSGSQLNYSNLAHANLIECDFWRANLRYVDFSKATFRNTCLEETDLSNSNLSCSNLCDANLQGVILTNSNLDSSDLSYADLRDANLEFAVLTNANLSHVNLSGANLCNADLSNTDLSKANLRNANLSRANLSATNFYKANLTDAVLIDANLFRTSLRKAETEGVDLKSANCYDVEGIGEDSEDYILEDIDFLDDINLLDDQ
jgi:uncharacterized protein YjbI with pentapeptide repeats